MTATLDHPATNAELDSMYGTPDEAEALLAAEFMEACRNTDANALATWAPKVRDWQNTTISNVRENTPKRCPTLAEAMEEALDYNSGPAKPELMQLLLNVAYGSDLVNEPARARALLDRMAKTFAVNNAGL